MVADLRRQLAEDMLDFSLVLAGDIQAADRLERGDMRGRPLLDFDRRILHWPDGGIEACLEGIAAWQTAARPDLTRPEAEVLARPICGGDRMSTLRGDLLETTDILIAGTGADGARQVTSLRIMRGELVPWTVLVTRPGQLAIAVWVSLTAGAFGYVVRRRQYRAYMTAREKASMDALSGVLRREEFEEKLEAAVAKIKAAGGAACLLAIDLDHFKSVNDRFGHAAGDEVIRRCGQLIGGALRAGDIIGRVGGEEFMVLLPNLPKYVAAEVADRLRKRMVSQAFTFGSETVFVSTSIGVASLMAEDTVTGLSQRADRRLYMAKRRGRNCVVWEDEGDADY
ncbi:GGDEF domain-containing protein [Zavarzinia compransoris]|nr:GGDEF domain-containing protein [Zavarzinia compransoris]